MTLHKCVKKRHLQAILWGWVFLTSSTALAQEPIKELLWPQGAPDSKGDAPKDMPTMTYYLPSSERNTGAAIIICPGGSYLGLATDHEGRDVGAWLNSIGVVGVLLEYRTRAGGYGHPAPLQDAQRAIRTVRARAGELGIDANRIGILGFSAGGHLAATAGTHFDNGNPDAEELVEKVSSRPDVMILGYPVIAFGEPFSHLGSQYGLIGKDAPTKLVHELSAEKHVTPETPPTFLFHTDEDRSVPAENSIVFYQALRQANVPVELHVYRTGRHGVGLAEEIPGTAAWRDACKLWLHGLGFLDKASQ